MEGAAIVAKHLGIERAGRQVLKNLSFQITPGTVTGLIGPSGSGKTTLMRGIVGLQKISSGALEVLGLSAGSAPLRDRIGYMAQSPSVYGDLSVRQNVAYFARILGYPRSEADRVIQLVDLNPQQEQTVDTLSGGQQARASLAIALLGRPALLVLDEPTVGLDPVLREDLWQLFRRLSSEGTTLIISSHVMEEASRCDQLLLVRDGRLIANDSIAAILQTTGTPNVEAAFLQLVTRKKGKL
jgi:ABC-2 type transport system ATP-binding protein